MKTLSHLGDPSAHPRWKDFEAYASRVRAIALFPFDGPKWCELWQELVSRLGPRPLLPNLQSVSLNAISPHELTASAFLLVSPSVTTLHFAFKHDILGVHAALPRVSDRAPAIDTLRLSVVPWEGMNAHCPRLRHISVLPPLDGRRLEYLAQFSGLRSLSISLSDAFALTDQLALPSLNALHVKGKWPCLTGMLTATHAPNLSVLALEAWEAGTPAQQVAKHATDCIRAISAKHSESLTSLTVQASYGRAPSPSSVRSVHMVPDAFEGSILDIARPLLALHGLRTLALVLPDCLDLDCPSGDLRAMAEAWRGLEELHVEFWGYFAPPWIKPPREERPRGGPLEALGHFARHCPRLRKLHLPPMDATRTSTLGMGDDLEPLESGRLGHGLDRLIVSKVKISQQDDDSESGKINSSSESVVEFVGRVFPKAAWAFREDRIAVVDGWVVAHENATCLASANVNSSVSSISSVTMCQRSPENPEVTEVIEKHLIVRFSRQ
ncbi:hypothetical protein GSI_11525 [Ganoderma sinense ZZ0214-1]|uniref:F-box domain-containing protein n=1 Tax=Ganoderma sinense ZZ0214-1 TaxID=1077348 RepID=A0A2G8RW81_9APHY|nr:hypothetical protein GSI_11525 [Ganoderma sinense ZZ0214-1]